MADIDIADPGASAAALKAALVDAVEPLVLTEPLTSNHVLASVIGAAIVNAGSGGTPGPATVTTTTGTGTPAQVSVTIGGGGDIQSITSPPLVAGAFTVLPDDPSDEPVTGGDLVGASLLLGLQFSPAFVGGSPYRGVYVDSDGYPGFTTASVDFSVDGDGPLPTMSTYGGRGVSVVVKQGDDPTLYLRPAKSQIGGSRIELAGVGPHEGGIINTPGNIFFRADGVVGRPLHIAEDTILGFSYYVATWDDDNGTWIGASDVVSAAAEWGAFTPTRRALSSVAIGSDENLERIVIEGDGNTSIDNGVLRLKEEFAIAGLPAAPTLGMMAVVSDALAPTIGATVADGGAATAKVWYNGTNWTVTGV